MMLPYSIEALYEALFNAKAAPEDANVRIAVPYEGEDIFPHFGKATHFAVYDIENGKVIVRTIVNTNDLSRGNLPEVMEQGKVNAILCGGIGEKMIKICAERKIMVYCGVKGNVEEAINALLEGRLEYDEELRCTHRDAHQEDADRPCILDTK